MDIISEGPLTIITLTEIIFKLTSFLSNIWTFNIQGQQIDNQKIMLFIKQGFQIKPQFFLAELL